jgi:hypothetical protein
MRDDFAAFILTHGRPHNVKTYHTLRKQGYTGPIFLIVDDQDPARAEYVDQYGDQVVVFDKAKAASTTDRCDNFPSLGTVLFARNACYDIARDMGIRYFVQLDDDYNLFEYRYSNGLVYWPVRVGSMDAVLSALVGFLEDTTAQCVCMSQGGDFLGGRHNTYAKSVRLLRKAMNSFVCDVDRPIQYLGRLNDDVNTYLERGRMGDLLCSTTQVSLVQTQTQAQGGGLTGAYLEAGTYTKSFYSVMVNPSSVTIRLMGDTCQRIHHHIKWSDSVPKIVSETTRKPR